jgi:hypothetical protein
MVSASAPQVPLGVFAEILHGPMLHILQHKPSAPNLHTTLADERSHTVSMPRSFAVFRICVVAASVSKQELHFEDSDIYPPKYFY